MPSRNSTPGHGSLSSSRLPSRSTKSQRLAICAPAEMPSPDSGMRQRLERLVDRPVLVHVDLQRQVGDGPDGADTVEVEAVAPAELQLQPAEARRGALRTARHVVGIAEPDRPAGRRPLAAEAQQPPDWQLGQLAAEIMERMVEGGARGLRIRCARQGGENLVERERVAAQRAPPAEQ